MYTVGMLQMTEVLIVDSDSQHQMALSAYLSPWFKVREVATLEEAFASISVPHAGAVLASIDLDDPVRVQAASRLASIYDDLPVVVIEKVSSSGKRRAPAGSLFEHAVVVPDDFGRILLGLNIALAAVSLPQPLAAIIDTFCRVFPEALIILDDEFRCIYASEPATRYTDRSAAQLTGLNIWDVFPDSKSPFLEEQLKKAAAFRTFARFDYFLTSREVWVDCELLPWRGGISLLMSDVTRRKKLELAGAEWKALTGKMERMGRDAAFHPDQQLQLVQALAVELAQTEQRERRRMAQLVHDNLLQLLVTTKVRLAALLPDIKDSSARESIEQIESFMREAIQISRSILVEVSPPLLHESRLSPALHWLAQHMRDKYDLQVQVDVEQDPDLPDDSRYLLFEATRELLFNVLRHSGRQSATISLSVTESRAVLTVADNGVGFDPEGYLGHSAFTGLFGLFSIKQRVELVGGSLEVHSRRGAGTRVSATIPLKPPAAELRPASKTTRTN